MTLHIPKSCWQQDITKKEYLWILTKSIGITAVTAWLFYRSFWAILFLIPIGIWYFRMMLQELIHRKEGEFQLQFKEAILAVSSAMNTGYSVENAFREAQKELVRIYPEETRILKEMLIIVRQLRIHVPMEQILEEMSKRVPTEDVRNFVAVFVAAKKSGGNMIAIIHNTANQIGEKVDVKREIDTILASPKYEFRIMSVVPYMIIGYMSVSFPEFMDCLYGNALGIGVMTICLFIYLAAYYLGVKIIRIEV